MNNLNCRHYRFSPKFKISQSHTVFAPQIYLNRDVISEACHLDFMEIGGAIINLCQFQWIQDTKLPQIRQIKHCYNKSKQIYT